MGITIEQLGKVLEESEITEEVMALVVKSWSANVQIESLDDEIKARQIALAKAVEEETTVIENLKIQKEALITAKIAPVVEEVEPVVIAK